jgi:hypothetical protein
MTLYNLSRPSKAFSDQRQLSKQARYVLQVAFSPQEFEAVTQSAFDIGTCRRQARQSLDQLYVVLQRSKQ